MQEIMKSIEAVFTSPLFFTNMGMITAFGMVIGATLDDGVRGFRKSVAIILPYTLIIATTTITRLIDVSSRQPFSFTAYNSLVSLTAVSTFYLIGLFLGHVVFEYAQKSARKEIKQKIEDV